MVYVFFTSLDRAPVVRDDHGRPVLLSLRGGREGQAGQAVAEHEHLGERAHAHGGAPSRVSREPPRGASGGGGVEGVLLRDVEVH